MKTININFDLKSIHNAIKQLEKAKNDFDNCHIEFLKRCCQWVISKANENLNLFYMKNEVTSDIMANWQSPVIYFNAKENRYIATIQNISEKSVFIEFGVGIVGRENPHPEANNQEEQDYQYNVQSRYKNRDGSWIFKVDNEAYLDIKAENIMSDRTEHPHTVRTKGQQAQLYLYNALMEFIEQGVGQEIWQEVLNKKMR